MSFLLLPSMRVQAANMLSSQIALGGPALMAAHGFAHALCVQADLGCRVRGVAYVHHAVQPLGERVYGRFHPQQRRGAALTFSSIAGGRDYSSRNKQALSLQPVACAHLRVSLVVETDAPVSLTPVVRWLQTARFAGGIVTGHRDPQVHTDIDDAFDALTQAAPGFVVTDRRDLIANAAEADPAAALVRALGGGMPDAGDWLAAATVGYAALTPFADREGVRQGRSPSGTRYLHAYVEPLVGLVQHVPLRQYALRWERLFWRDRWHGDGVYMLGQDTAD